MLTIKQIFQYLVRQGNYLFFFNNGKEQMKRRNRLFFLKEKM